MIPARNGGPDVASREHWQMSSTRTGEPTLGTGNSGQMLSARNSSQMLPTRTKARYCQQETSEGYCELLQGPQVVSWGHWSKRGMLGPVVIGQRYLKYEGHW